MSWTNFLLPAAMTIAGGFDVWDRSQRRSQMNRDARARQAIEMAHFQAMQNRGSGGGGSRGNIGAASRVLEENYAKALAMLQPFSDQAKETLPIISQAFHQGVEGFTPLMGQVLSPEFTNRLINRPQPPQIELPKFLVGGNRDE